MWCIILNPNAANGEAARQRAALERHLQEQKIAYTIAATTAKNHATALVQQSVAAGHRRFVAVGGDGTINEVVNGICTQNIAAVSDLTLAVIPIGTGNDWIKMHRIPNNIAKAVTLLNDHKTIKHSIGKAIYYDDNDDANNKSATRYFMNVAGLAYDAFVVQQTLHEKNRFLPSKIFYMYLIFKCLFQYTPERVKIILDNGATVIEDEVYTINIGVCSYSGGGCCFVPQANPAADTLGVTVIRAVSKLNVLLSTPLFYNKKIGTHPRASLHTAKNITIQHAGELPTRLETDGEFCGYSQVDISLYREQLNVVVPK